MAVLMRESVAARARTWDKRGYALGSKKVR
jgi:hypothetical protein